MNRFEVGTEGEGYGQLIRRMLVPALFVAALFMVLLWRSPQQEASPVELLLAGPTMGTRYTVKVVAPGPVSEEGRAALETGIGQALELVDGAMSTWREDSELEQFNRHGVEPFAASAAFLEVMGAALEVSQRSGGAFDVTVGSLVDAWGFGPDTFVSPPSEERIEALLEAAGAERLRIDADRGTVEKSLATVRVDLSALAKGYAVDRVASVLSDGGYSDFMVEVGGEVVTRGRNADENPWQIGIEVPDPGNRAAHTVVALDDAALATSGDYRNFRLEDGLRISHIIDPRTGRPVAHSLASVSVVASTCMMADAWATALSVLGPEEGLELARKENLASLFIFRRDDGTLGEVSTASFERYRTTDRPGNDLP